MWHSSATITKIKWVTIIQTLIWNIHIIFVRLSLQIIHLTKFHKFKSIPKRHANSFWLKAYDSVKIWKSEYAYVQISILRWIIFI